MGTDKALIAIDGTAMAVRVARALEHAGAHDVVALGGDGPRLVAQGLRHVPDRAPGEGPLGAVVHSLGQIGSQPIVAVVPCDLLAPDPEVFSSLIARRAAADADVAVPVVDDRPQWAMAVWHRRTGRILADLFDSGERSLVGAVAGLRVELVEGLDPAGCADADTPADLPWG